MPALDNSARMPATSAFFASLAPDVPKAESNNESPNVELNASIDSSRSSASDSMDDQTTTIPTTIDAATTPITDANTDDLDTDTANAPATAPTMAVIHLTPPAIAQFEDLLMFTPPTPPPALPIPGALPTAVTQALGACDPMDWNTYKANMRILSDSCMRQTPYVGTIDAATYTSANVDPVKATTLFHHMGTTCAQNIIRAVTLEILSDQGDFTCIATGLGLIKLYTEYGPSADVFNFFDVSQITNIPAAVPGVCEVNKVATAIALSVMEAYVLRFHTSANYLRMMEEMFDEVSCTLLVHVIRMRRQAQDREIFLLAADLLSRYLVDVGSNARDVVWDAQDVHMDVTLAAILPFSSFYVGEVPMVSALLRLSAVLVDVQQRHNLHQILPPIEQLEFIMEVHLRDWEVCGSMAYLLNAVASVDTTWGRTARASPILSAGLTWGRNNCAGTKAGEFCDIAINKLAAC